MTEAHEEAEGSVSGRTFFRNFQGNMTLLAQESRIGYTKIRLLLTYDRWHEIKWDTARRLEDWSGGRICANKTMRERDELRAARRAAGMDDGPPPEERDADDEDTTDGEGGEALE
jgi:hypothetical protein